MRTKQAVAEMQARKDAGTLTLNVRAELADLPTIALSECVEFQGSLKDLTTVDFNKLSAAIYNKGFLSPLYIWKTTVKKQPINYLMDGHQRFRVLSHWYDASTQIPYIEIQAKNKTEAAENLLTISSQFGKTTNEGLHEFAATFGVDFDVMNDTTTFSESFGVYKDFGDSEEEEDFGDKNKEIDTAEFSDKMYFKLEYSETDYNRVKSQLSDIGVTPEAALFKFLFPNEKF